MKQITEGNEKAFYKKQDREQQTGLTLSCFLYVFAEYYLLLGESKIKNWKISE